MAVSNYPKTVKEVLDPDIIYKKETISVLKSFRKSHPWKGTLRERQEKFASLHIELCRIYNLNTKLFFLNGKGSSGNSCYIRKFNLIILRGRLSAVTYLHEFFHARGGNEKQSCRWSINLFAKVFKEDFKKAKFQGHMVVK